MQLTGWQQPQRATSGGVSMKVNDVTNAQQMKDALLSHGGIEGVRVAVSDSLGRIRDWRAS